MGAKSPARFTLGRQSSLAPDRGGKDEDEESIAAAVAAVDPRVRLMYLANEGDIDGINTMLESGTNVNFRDIDGRTALHVAACQGRPDVVQLLLSRGAEVDPMDRWGSTPLADAVYYKNHDVIKLLEEHGAEPPLPCMSKMLEKSQSMRLMQRSLIFLTVRKSQRVPFVWHHGVELRWLLKPLERNCSQMKTKKAFRDELTLLQKIRHPNVVQFLGAVTQSSPMMIVTEYLSKGDLREYLDRKRALKPELAVKFALDIARGMNYLHEHKPEAIIHRDLEPSNILRDDSGHPKVADFGVSKLLVVKNTVKEDKPVTPQDTSWRYMAPEVYRNEEYDTKVDVFSFALILQEMIEGCVPFPMSQESEVPKAYVANERPPFNAPAKRYPLVLKELIQDCWDKEPSRRPTFRQIITKLEVISHHLERKNRWKVRLGMCLPIFGGLMKRDYVNPSSRSSHSFNR
ncbi:PREDICTED: serine/threonine-protein kinase STY17-like isoform X2 [Tarenaya hassleriana]|uniref:serine/threonine-protein kinase STY17-like isoform X2 n=1 Tax=Tarenaya hassleriana TaxID=28532 RepID=UPI00053C5702|nr:PREDICTED: serine/threonine-protein kinase STY17-like isoform X2 [Tarenaya hassleriana]